MNEVKPSAFGDAQEVKVKVRINHNGIILIASAQMVEKKEAQEEQQNGANEAEPQSPSEPSPTQDAAPTGEPMDTQDVSHMFRPFKCRLSELSLPQKKKNTKNASALCPISVPPVRAEDDHPADNFSNLFSLFPPSMLNSLKFVRFRASFSC